MKAKAIQTRHNGYFFRSRLEARWAIFFESLSIEYEYEPEGFELPSGRYLPDFYLPKIRDGLWVEIKNAQFGKGENISAKLTELAERTAKGVTLLCGEPMLMVNRAHGDWGSHPEVEMFFGAEGWDNNYAFCECPWCGKIGFEFDGRGARVCGWEKHHANEEEALAAIKHLGHHRADDKCYTGASPKLVAAAIKARAARFEFGGR